MSARAAAEPRGLRRDAAAAYVGESGEPLSAECLAHAERHALNWKLVPRPGAKYVYFIRVRGFDLVKIGFSVNPWRRLAELENGSGMLGGLTPLLRIRGDRATELALHRMFAEQRLFGEWYRLSGPVAEWLSSALTNLNAKWEAE